MKKMDYIIRTDLAIQNKKAKLINSEIKSNVEIKNYIDNNCMYTNIIFKNLETKSYKNNLVNIIIQELKKYYKKYSIKKNNSCLVVGLGNENVSSDSLGAESIKYIIPTLFFKNINDYRSVFIYKPGVIKDTGIMPFEGIKALKKELKPDFIIVIDSLICSNLKYLNNVIQITDIGIIPGSGLANYQEEISNKTLGIPVIVIGVATAIEVGALINNALKNSNKLEYKLGYDYIVSSKDIDLTIKDLGYIIGKAINGSLNCFKEI